MPVENVVDGYLTGVGARRLGNNEWGLTIRDDWPLDMGIRLSDGLLRIQAFAVPADQAPADAAVLHWNRRTRLVRFSRTQSGDIWVQADLPAEAVTEAELDRILGLVVEAARSARM
jgi:hypothetical protein